MSTFIKATNPMKKPLLAIFKNLGADKVTKVTQIDENVFQARLFTYAGNRQYNFIGEYRVTVANLEQGIVTASERVDEVTGGVEVSPAQTEQDNTLAQAAGEHTHAS